jgi:hypothetical protein
MIRIQGISFQFTIYEYAFLVGYQVKRNPAWRLGQAYFNVLNVIAPDLANEIRGTDLDPFYKEKDDGIQELIEWLETKNAV